MIIRKETGAHGDFLRFNKDLGTSVKVDTFEYDGDEDITEVCGVTVDDYVNELSLAQEDVSLLSERIGNKITTMEFLTGLFYNSEYKGEVERERLEQEFIKGMQDLIDITYELRSKTKHLRRTAHNIYSKLN